MKFFFADSMDMIDPSFNFETENRSERRIRQRDDLYPHEILSEPPYHGVLVSKSLVDGYGSAGSRYSLAQRQRFWRNGVKLFMRLDQSNSGIRQDRPFYQLEAMGDCGAFSYVKEKVPPVSTSEVVDFYDRCEFDYGISVDHVILGYETKAGSTLPGFADTFVEWRERQAITLELADEFFVETRSSGVGFTPLGVAQGWSPESYSSSVRELQKMGYHRIALGGMVPLKTSSILECLESIKAVRHANTELHLLGITRCEHISRFREYGGNKL